MNGSDIGTLLQALPYIRRHKGATVVVKCGGEIARDRLALGLLAEDAALCAHVGLRMVVVHGGGPQATEMARRLGHEAVVIDGRRVTDDETLEIAKMVFRGQINTNILGALRRHGLRPVGLSGVDGGMVHAVRRPETEMRDPKTGKTRRVDFGHVGDIVRVESALLSTLLDEGYTPVVASLGADDRGNIYNINADTVAARLATSLNADKLVLLTDAPGLLADPDDRESLISHISAARAEKMLDTGAIRGGMVPKLTTLIEAVRGGVARGHILDGKQEHALLLELFTKDGTGTMVTTRDEEKRYLDE